MLTRLTGFVLLLSSLLAAGDPVENLLLTDFDGRKHDPFAQPGTKAAVLVFVNVDCPIANFYQPTLRKLARKYEKQGVLFFQIHADPDLTAKEAAKHALDFGVVSPGILDPKQKWARLYKAKVTPEAHLVVRDGTVAYRGRIDDTYAAYGKRRPEPTTRDLEAALTAVLAGKKVAVPLPEAVGCQILIED